MNAQQKGSSFLISSKWIEEAEWSVVYRRLLAKNMSYI